MALTAGEKLGSYEILAPLGAGGMGEVYHARDTKLGRDVAIKVLPEEFTQHPQKLARFEREAKLLAALNHTNVATLYGLEERSPQPERSAERSGVAEREAVGVGPRGPERRQLFLVMELVEGETLAERIAKGPIPPDEALPLFIQIAEGLEAAHEKGIIHRDLKPANIKITPEGKVKILDFGLAKAFAPEEEVSEVMSRSPTLTKGTALGTILGTAAYMSPEQAKGKTVDRHTDIWAFGCCLYEALTGRLTFRGGDVSETLASILRDEPKWESLPASVPRGVRGIIQKCVRKDKARRLNHVGDARIELQDAEQSGIAEIAETKRGPLRLVFSFLAGLIAAVALFSAAGGQFNGRFAGVPDLDLTQLTANPAENTILSGALSPDAKYLAYTDLSGLTVRLLETGETYPVPLPEDLVVDEVDWFPDGTTLLLGGSPSTLWKTSLFGGSPRKIADLAYRAAISPTGEHIAYLSSEESPSRRVYVTGPDGQNRNLLVEAMDGESFWELAWSPDGNWLLVGNWKRGTGNFIDAVRVETGERNVVLSDPRLFQNWRAALPFAWTSDSRLVYGRRGQPPNELSSNLWSISIDTEAVVRGVPTRVTQLTGVNFRDLSLTADGRRLAFLAERNQSDVYVLDLQDSTAASRRLTADERDDYPKGWFPAGDAVLLNSNRTGPWNIYSYELEATSASLAVSGSTDAELSPDGAWILYETDGEWMRAPAAGGPGEMVAIGDAIHCAAAAKQCILGERDATSTEYVFHKLDPFEGKQNVVARIVDNPPFTNWDLSPDAELAAVVHNDGRIRIVELATGAEHVITNEDWLLGEFVSFAFDGKAVFVDGSRSGRLATTRKSLLRVSLGPETEVEELRYRRNVWHVQPEASPDGRYLAFAAMTFSANVWMIEGF